MLKLSNIKKCQIYQIGWSKRPSLSKYPSFKFGDIFEIDDEQMMNRWWTDDEQMMNWWWTDDEQMMNWWWTDDEEMMNWWWTDDGLMMKWCWTDDELMMNWWWTDDELMRNWWGTDEELVWSAKDYDRLPWYHRLPLTDWFYSIEHSKLYPGLDGYSIYIYIPDSTNYKSTASGANKIHHILWALWN